MKITRIQAWRVSPPNDVWHFVSITTDAGPTGWGEITGSGNNAAAVALCRDAAPGLLGKDPLRLDDCLAPYRNFRYPPARDKLAAVSWSGFAQALWDLRGQIMGQPLYALLGGTAKPLPLYANLNRGLLRDRSPQGHARHTEAALADGFSWVKVTPFDELTPWVIDKPLMANGLARLRAAAETGGTHRIAIDCHQRFSLPLARAFLDALAGMGEFRWVEDILPQAHAAEFHSLREGWSGVTWAGGENTVHLDEAVRYLSGPEKPDVFMPDIKYVCGIDIFAALARTAEALGCLVSPHNPSGPISQAFSAHATSFCSWTALEYPYLAVPERTGLMTPAEPVEKGVYHLSDRPGIGVAPSAACLENHGALLFDAAP